MSEPARNASPHFTVTKKRLRFLGLTWDDTIKAFFGGNALVAFIILSLITVFLVREGAGFFGQNRQNLEVYRRSGMEFVDGMRRQVEGHTALTRYLSDLRLRLLTHYTEVERLSLEQANAKLGDFDAFADRFAGAVDPLRGLVSELGELATTIKTRFIVEQDREEERRQLLAVGKNDAAAAVKIDPVNFEAELKAITGQMPAYHEAAKVLREGVESTLLSTPAMPTAETSARMKRFRELVRIYVTGFPSVVAELAAWDFRRPVPVWESFTAFCFGRQWLTASFWQDWYGILPLLTGSLLVSLVALMLAVPFGVGAAIYVNQLASPREQRWIKPGIEFIAALPSVVLGFFGIAVLGELLRSSSQSAWLSWLPGFPYSERLNILTAGCLLALIAVPTIFTLAEDAINNVPRAFKEASFALGASRLQTIVRIIVPAALSGIISAVLLGLGRVIGETMVVLLCAGNRIAIPDFTRGLAVVTEPVHTMTGIIAQEMGEVVRGSIHYRALFVVGLLLFVLSLLINFAAQKIVRRYKISIG